MNILVTGATGFVGTHVLQAVVKKYPKATICLLTNRTVEGYKCIKHHNYKIDKKEFARAGIDNIDVVLHLGASVPATITESWVDAEKYIYNIESTYSIIHELPGIPRKFIYTSSVIVYEYSDICIDEDTKVAPNTVYGMSKAMCELMLQQWATENNVDLTILRLGSCYGAGDKRESLIPFFVKKVKNYQNIEIYSNGNEHRCYIHVKDVAKAICNAIDLKHVPIVNVVGEKRYSVKYIAETIADFQGDYDKKLIKIENQNVKVRDDFYSNKLLQQCLLDKQIPFEEGLWEEYQNIS